MITKLKKEPLKLLPNIRHEDAEATSGYIWGKPAQESNILKELGIVKINNDDASIDTEKLDELNIALTDIVSERWIATDDREKPSFVQVNSEKHPLFEFIEIFPKEMLGEQHINEHGAYLKTVMKYLDTNSLPEKGSLSVQVHPENGHPSRPAKPEMWKGHGKLYIGWNKDVDEEIIKNKIEENSLEELMNTLEINDSDLILVSGGIIHAIRYDTFTAEWSKAPGKDDIAKGNIKDATVSPYDRTDGKTPRPGKEDINGTFDIMRHADTFSKTVIDKIRSKPIEKFSDKNGNKIISLFRTPNVFVDEINIDSEIELSTEKRGFPLYLEKGAVEIFIGDRSCGKIKSGEELFVPFFLDKIKVVALDKEPAVLYKWFVPFKDELE